MSTRFKIYLALLLISAITGLLKFRKLEPGYRYLTVLLIITFISEVISRVLIAEIRNSSPVYHFFSPLELVLLAFILWNLSLSPIIRRSVIVVYAGLVVFSIINSLFFQHLMTFNSNIDIVKMPACFFMAFLVLAEKNHNMINKSALLDADILVLIAIIWFNMVSFFFMVSHNYLIDQGISTRMIANIHYASNIIYYLLYLIALIIHVKKDHAAIAG